MRRSFSETSLDEAHRHPGSVFSWLDQCRDGLRRRRSPATVATISEGPPTTNPATFGDYVCAEMKTEPMTTRFNTETDLKKDCRVLLPLPRQKLRLHFIEIDSRGEGVNRVASRHEILSEVRANWEDGARALKKRLSCGRGGMDVDWGGNSKMKNGKKGSKCAGNRITARDMRQIDPAFSATCAIWVREDAIVVSLEGVHAIILDNKMLVFDPENEMVQPPIWYTRKRLMNDRADAFMPFEFTALEGVLIHACLVLETDFLKIEPELRKTLGELPKALNSEKLEKLRCLEQRLNQYYARVRRVQSALQSLLDEDEDMAEMYLTEKKRNPGLVRNPVDHDEAEMMLETYLQNIDDLTSKAELLNRAIDDTENLIEIHLDTMQNRLLLVDLLITVITTTLSFGTMVTSIFGMNFPLPNAMQTVPSSKFYFLGIIASTLIVMSVGLVILVRWCRRQGIYRGRQVGARRKSKSKEQAGSQTVEQANSKAEDLLSSTHPQRQAGSMKEAKDEDWLPG